MRVVLPVFESGAGVEPVVGLALPSRALGAGVRVCAPWEFADAASDRS
ncbi:hypothetical protein GCM10010211_33700 [Streptomyces albospinus]|uniref:Uncharacterized protein n=1 Tax=Streptomyces albospinus TaxID=285515 RepID=A0ABQ2V4L9_9ACTN|nr:hypothetical protein GCM10010211_33700 [Streptomyces albospinus]